MGEMRALSIQQPWAWAIAAAGKDIENRTWPTSYRGRLAIHASKAYDDGALLPTPAALSLFMDAAAEDIRTGVPALAPGAIVAMATLVGCHPDRAHADPARPCSPWAVAGQWHWEILAVRPLAEPVPCRGMLGLWPLPDDVMAAVRQQPRGVPRG
jgi:ASCH domain